MTTDDRYVTVAITRRSIVAVAVALAVASAAVFAYVGIHELSYAGSHPHAYGPAKVVAAASGAGALLSAAVALVAFAVLSVPGGRVN